MTEMNDKNLRSVSVHKAVNFALYDFIFQFIVILNEFSVKLFRLIFHNVSVHSTIRKRDRYSS